MPSGLLAVASLIVLAVMFLIMDWTGSRRIDATGWVNTARVPRGRFAQDPVREQA